MSQETVLQLVCYITYGSTDPLVAFYFELDFETNTEKCHFIVSLLSRINWNIQSFKKKTNKKYFIGQESFKKFSNHVFEFYFHEKKTNSSANDEAPHKVKKLFIKYQPLPAEKPDFTALNITHKYTLYNIISAQQIMLRMLSHVSIVL